MSKLYRSINFLEQNKKAQAFILITITILAFVVRMYKVGVWSYWIDEILTLNRAKDTVYYFINSPKISGIFIKTAITIFGESEWSSRLPGVIFGALTIPTTYIFTKKTFGFKVAVTASLFLLFLPKHIFYSQNARYYSALILFNFIATILFYIGLEKNKIRYLILAFFFLGLAFFERTFAFLLLPVWGVYIGAIVLFPYSAPIKLTPKTLLTLIAIPVIGYGCYEAYRLIILDESLYVMRFISTVIGKTNSNPRSLLTSFVLVELNIILVVLAGIGGWFLLKERSRIGLYLSLNGFLPLVILMGLSVFSQAYTRYVLFVLPSWCILAAVGLWRLSTTKNGRGNLINLLLGSGLLLLLLMTPLWKDIQYYWPLVVSSPWFLVLVLCFVVVVIVLGGYWGVYLFKRIKNAPGNGRIVSQNSQRAIWWSGLFIPSFLLLFVGTTLYFSAQHGYRDNIKDVVARYSEVAQQEDVLIMHHTITLIGSYYLGEYDDPLDETQIANMLDEDKDFWVISEFGMTQTTIRGEPFVEWAAEKCVVVDTWEQFVAGKDWKQQLYRCNASG